MRKPQNCPNAEVNPSFVVKTLMSSLIPVILSKADLALNALNPRFFTHLLHTPHENLRASVDDLPHIRHFDPNRAQVGHRRTWGTLDARVKERRDAHEDVLGLGAGEANAAQEENPRLKCEFETVVEDLWKRKGVLEPKDMCEKASSVRWATTRHR